MDKAEIVFLNAVFFVIGFVIVFSIVGIALQLVISSLAVQLMDDLRIVGGLIIILFGVVLILANCICVPLLSRDIGVHFKRLRSSFASSLLFGIAFAIGWTPCVGPILGSIYALAAE
ncbi:MAG: hypothetical protein KGI04_00415 [Candidatus Micrarchaeota archaeon]|nr:hypothetical protein [Candidatus Micrarchaeota archaeon]